MTFGPVTRSHREGDFEGRRPSGWLGLLRTARLHLYRNELRALRELDVVHALFEARGPDALACLAGRLPAAELPERIVVRTRQLLRKQRMHLAQLGPVDWIEVRPRGGAGRARNHR